MAAVVQCHLSLLNHPTAQDPAGTSRSGTTQDPAGQSRSETADSTGPSRTVSVRDNTGPSRTVVRDSTGPSRNVSVRVPGSQEHQQLRLQTSGSGRLSRKQGSVHEAWKSQYRPSAAISANGTVYCTTTAKNYHRHHFICKTTSNVVTV